MFEQSQNQPALSERSDFTEVIMSVAMLLSLLVYGGLLSQWLWPGDLLCHFRIQYIIALAPFLIFALAAHRFKNAAIIFSAFMVNAVVVAPLFCNKSVPPLSSRQNHELTVIQLNLNSANNQFDAVRSCIEKNEADVVCLQEVTAEWQKYLHDNLKNYPYQFVLSRPDPFGVAILSRSPLTETTVQSFGQSSLYPTLTANLTVGEETVTVICTHPYPPISPNGYNQRNRQLERIASFTANLKNTILLCGDLNATRWSASMSQLLDQGNLLDTSNGFGVQPTWPANCFLLWIPIDQIFVSKNVATLERKILPDVGSDHYPVLARLVFPQKAKPVL